KIRRGEARGGDPGADIRGKIRDHGMKAMPVLKLAAVAFGAAFALLLPCVSDAAELKIFGSRVTKVILGELGPGFEKASGFQPQGVADVAAVMKRRIEGGEPFDLAVLVNFQIDDLVKSGRILAETRADIMSSSIGVAVRRGA